MRLAQSCTTVALFLLLPSFSGAEEKPDHSRSSRLQPCALSDSGDATALKIQPVTLEPSASPNAFSCVKPFTPLTRAQSSSANDSRRAPAPDQAPAHPPIPPHFHRFWDRENDLLFAAVGASRALDYASTLNFRRRGRDEAFLTNDIVDNHAAFAAIEAGATALSIGVSYLFHHYNHHKLERWTSIVHASLATTGAIRNYCLESVDPSTTP